MLAKLKKTSKSMSSKSVRSTSRNFTNRVYLDYASSTPISAKSLNAMRRAEKLIGNPGAINTEGVEAKRALEKARTGIAAEIGCKSREIIFTSGITESNNRAILGFFKKIVSAGRAPKDTRGIHCIVSATEHSSVLECFREIEKLGGLVTKVSPNSKGIISPETIRKALRKETIFVSIGWANNEIGIIQPLGSIGLTLRKYEEENGTKIILHTDAGQGPLYLPAQVHSLRADLFSFGASKIYGPHGIGALYVNNRTELEPIILGGGQERGLRSGTENIALAVGFAAALSEAANIREKESKRIRKLRDKLAEGIIAAIPGAVINGDLRKSLPHMLNISIPRAKSASEYFVLLLDRAGIAASTKSACDEGERQESHVVAALHPDDPSRARNTLRLSLGRDTSVQDVSRAIFIFRTTWARHQ